MESEGPPPGSERVKIEPLGKIAARFERRRDPRPSETGVLRDLGARPPSFTALRRALAQLADARGHERAVLDALVGKLDHMHDDVAAVLGKLGIWREACGTPRRVTVKRAPDPERKHTPEKRRPTRKAASRRPPQPRSRKRPI